MTSARTAAHRYPRSYGPKGNAFNGRVMGVQLSIIDAPENADRMVDPEDAIRVAMARQ